MVKPESELRILPDVTGKEVVELGCGTAYFGAWLKRAGAARVVGVDVDSRTARDGAADGRGVRPRARADRGERGGRAAAGRVVRPRRSRSTAPRSGATRSSGSPRRRGCCARAASSSSCAARRCGSSASPDEGKTTDRAASAADGLYKLIWRGRRPGGRVPPGQGEMLAILRANGFELARLPRALRAGRRHDHEYYDDLPADWAKQWPAEEIWRRACTAPAPSLDVAAAAGDPRAAPDPVRRRRAGVRGDRGRSGRARTRQGALGARRGRRAARARLRHRGRLRGRVYGKPGPRRTPRRCSRASRARRTRSCPGWP